MYATGKSNNVFGRNFKQSVSQVGAAWIIKRGSSISWGEFCLKEEFGMKKKDSKFSFFCLCKV